PHGGAAGCLGIFPAILTGYGRPEEMAGVNLWFCLLGFPPMLKIGLTGGIGSGKTRVADFFESWGASVVDTDAIAHELTAPGGGAIELIRGEFGPAMIAPDGSLDRRAMRELVFDDPGARVRLEAILHPMIG